VSQFRTPGHDVAQTTRGLGITGTRVRIELLTTQPASMDVSRCRSAACAPDALPLAGASHGLAEDRTPDRKVEGHGAMAEKYDEAFFTILVNRFRHALVTAPIGAEPAVLQSYLQRCIDEMRGSLALLPETLDLDTHTKRKAVCAELLHSFLKESPFLRRALEKPLGYAGDFEMMNMLYRDPWEGKTALGRALNVCFTNEPAAIANKNRIAYLGELICKKALNKDRIRIAKHRMRSR
jgi:hypothetical protein